MIKLTKIGKTVYSQEEQEAFNATRGILNLRIGAMNAVASFMMFDCIQHIKKTPLFKHEGKRLLQQAMKEYEKYEIFIASIGKKHYQIWLDVSDNYNDAMNRHTKQMVQSIHNAFVRLKVPYAKERAYLETARLLSTYAVNQHDAIILKYKTKWGHDMSEKLECFCIRKCSYLWRKATDILVPKVSCRLEELNKDEEVKKAFGILQAKLLDAEMYSQCATTAFLDNEDIMEKSLLEDVRRKKAEYERKKAEEKGCLVQTKKQKIRKMREKSNDITPDDIEQLKGKFNKKHK